MINYKKMFSVFEITLQKCKISLHIIYQSYIHKYL